MGFNAARGFVGGAAWEELFSYDNKNGFNAARGFVGGAALNCLLNTLRHYGVSMPHAALWVVQREDVRSFGRRFLVSMPHAALWVVQQQDDDGRFKPRKFQCRTRLCGWCSPHPTRTESLKRRFNAARGFVGGAAPTFRSISEKARTFQCRTRLCGWCSFVALSSCPPKRKKPFWKVSGNLRCLTENM